MKEVTCSKPKGGCDATGRRGGSVLLLFDQMDQETVMAAQELFGIGVPKPWLAICNLRFGGRGVV